jgi:hypothetical protein
VFLNDASGSRRERRCARRPKKWAAKNAKDRCKCGQSMNLGASDRKAGVSIIAEELNMKRKTARQTVKEDLGMRKNFRKNGASNLDR